MRRVFDVYSSIFQAHRGFINGEPFTSDSYERTYEHSYQPKFFVFETNGRPPSRVSAMATRHSD